MIAVILIVFCLLSVFCSRSARRVLRLSCTLALAVILTGTVFYAPVNALAGMTKSIHELVGEDRLYSIDFLFFTRLAEGQLRFSATDNPQVFRAELIGRTLGVASWLSGDRTQSYTSLMTLAEDGSLSTLEHVSRILKRKKGKWQQSDHVYRYDYRSRKIFERKGKAGILSPEREHDIPEGQTPVDVLTAFYNLRAGVYGQLERGALFQIPTYAKGKFTEIAIRVLTIEEQAGYGYFHPDGLLVAAHIDPQIFETDSGNLYVWFNGDGVPERGIVEDLIGLGDVKGYLDMEGL